jgi:hypothetical protein
MALVVLLSLSGFGYGVYSNSPPADDTPSWHPGFIQFEVEQVSPDAKWVPPTRIDKGALQTILVNTSHIISIAQGRGDTSKTPRQSVLLDNGVELLVHGKYPEVVKLIRTSWSGLGKN